MDSIPDSVRWYAVLALITWGCAPLVRALFAYLPDRGASFGKPLGLLFVLWPVWFLASLFDGLFSSPALWISLSVIGIGGWALSIRRRVIDAAWVRALLITEFATCVTFFVYLGFRGFTPDIAGTEKPMDIALLSATARANAMPPLDPWMSGETINYYYLGYLLHGSVARLSDVATPVAFNLALATTFAMAIVAAAGVAYSAVRDRLGIKLALAGGALASFFVVLAGNLYAPVEFLRDPEATWNEWWWGGIGWNSSRIVVDTGERYADTINEFPSFSFVLGDLHPHVMALPFTIVCLALAVNFLFRPGQHAQPENWFADLWPVALSGAIIGAVYPMNSWDYPTYLGACGVAILVVSGWSRTALVRIATLGFASIAAWAPFWFSFVPFAGGDDADLPGVITSLPVVPRVFSTVGIYTGERTSAGEFMTVFGLLWAIAMIGLASELIAAKPEERLSVSRPVAAGAGIIAVVALATPAPVLIFAGLPLAASIWLLQRRNPGDRGQTVVAALCAAGFGLILITEFVFIQDVFGGRLNTLFKIYYQVWTLLGIGGAVLLVRLWQRFTGSVVFRGLWLAGLSAALLVGLVYPVVSANAWTFLQSPREWQGLDGSQYIADLAPDDLAAIRWLTENAKSGDVLLEAPGCSYEVNGGVPTSRMAAFTGIPTVIGWSGHESQWRGDQPELQGQIEPRRQDVGAMYSDPLDPARLDQYGITLLVIGAFEREGATGSCDAAGPFVAVLDDGYPGTGWTEVFSSGETRIYRRQVA